MKQKQINIKDNDCYCAKVSLLTLMLCKNDNVMTYRNNAFT
jgi:hypothetical protein